MSAGNYLNGCAQHGSLTAMFLRLSITAIVALIAIRCSAFQKLDLSNYPIEDRSVFLYNFTNQSFQPDVNTELTDHLRNELSRRGNFIPKKTREEAAWLLYGEVVAYRKEGRMFDNYRNAIRYELVIIAKVKLRRNTNANIEIVNGVEILANTQYSAKEGFVEEEFTARQRVLRILAEKIARFYEEEYVRQNGASPLKDIEKNSGTNDQDDATNKKDVDSKVTQ